MQISFAVTAKLISAFVFATQIVQSLYYLHTKFQASNHLLWLHVQPGCVGPGRKPPKTGFLTTRLIYQECKDLSILPYLGIYLQKECTCHFYSLICNSPVGTLKAISGENKALINILKYLISFILKILSFWIGLGICNHGPNGAGDNGDEKPCF